MKKLLVLVMSCNNPFYEGEDRMLRDIWAKDIIEGKYPNIEFYSYTASTDGKYHIDRVQHRIYVPANDSLHGTMEKTIKTFRLLKMFNIEFDYLFRTNTSTYINVKLLSEFVNTLYDKDIIWTHSLFSAFIDSGPYEYCLYGLGSGLLMSRHYFEVLIDNDVIEETYKMVRQDPRIRPDFMDIFYVTCTIDDNAMGYIINTYLINICHVNQEKRWKSIAGVFWSEDGVNINPDAKNSIMTIYRLHQNEERHKEFDIALNMHALLHEGSDDLSDILYKIYDDDILLYRPSGDPNVPSFYTIEHRDNFRRIIKEISKIPYLDD